MKTVRAGRFKAEIRHYEPYLIAEATVTKPRCLKQDVTMEDFTEQGWLAIMGYVTKKNVMLY